MLQGQRQGPQRRPKAPLLPSSPLERRSVSFSRANLANVPLFLGFSRCTGSSQALILTIKMSILTAWFGPAGAEKRGRPPWPSPPVRRAQAPAPGSGQRGSCPRWSPASRPSPPTLTSTLLSTRHHLSGKDFPCLFNSCSPISSFVFLTVFEKTFPTFYCNVCHLKQWALRSWRPGMRSDMHLCIAPAPAPDVGEVFSEYL